MTIKIQFKPSKILYEKKKQPSENIYIPNKLNSLINVYIYNFIKIK